jgi:hypothetical protein
MQVTEVFDTELIGEGAIATFNLAHKHLLTVLVATRVFTTKEYLHEATDCRVARDVAPDCRVARDVAPDCRVARDVAPDCRVARDVAPECRVARDVAPNYNQSYFCVACRLMLHSVTKYENHC